jgi:hypothetical protein
MSKHFWLTDEQLTRLRRFFSRSRGKLRVDVLAKPIAVIADKSGETPRLTSAPIGLT